MFLFPTYQMIFQIFQRLFTWSCRMKQRPKTSSDQDCEIFKSGPGDVSMGRSNRETSDVDCVRKVGNGDELLNKYDKLNPTIFTNLWTSSFTGPSSGG